MTVSADFFLPPKRVTHHCVPWKFDLFHPKRITHHCVPWKFDLFIWHKPTLPPTFTPEVVFTSLAAVVFLTPKRVTHHCVLEYRSGLIIILIPQVNLHFRVQFHYKRSSIFGMNPSCHPPSSLGGFYDCISGRLPSPQVSTATHRSANLVHLFGINLPCHPLSSLGGFPDCIRVTFFPSEYGRVPQWKFGPFISHEPILPPTFILSWFSWL